MTPDQKPSAVLIDDDDDLRIATAQLLTIRGFDVRAFADATTALAHIDADFPGVVITDVRMPGMSGIALFETLHDRDPDLAVILITGHGDVAMAVDAIKAGAWDFLTKPFDPEALIAAAARAAKARSLTLENRRLRAAADAEAGAALIGDTAAIVRLRGMIPMLADAALDLVIEGQFGTGREHYARLIHRAGRRSRHRFLKIDCATVTLPSLERELFARNGVIARAHRGTVFLDNLSRASTTLQDQLVRLAETRTVAFEGVDPDPVDVRIIASLDEGQRERVSAALYHRLAGVPLRMPPLAERTADIPVLLAHFIGIAARQHDVPMPSLADHVHRLATREWPGNVLELARTAERICLGLEEDAVTCDTPPAPLPARLDAFERTAIVEAVTASDGGIAGAIERLQIPRKTFYYRVKRLGIDLRALRQRRP
ncbi:sigma-54-dependent transcriptional regulator [Sphingomonas sp. R86521]|uniref:sigma-54-dependent transcriptional regulator n=1 Tax=Sphingomonas sp. R86521 TaxID=3093860 RepID=UPI0036D2A8CD